MLLFLLLEIVLEVVVAVMVVVALVGMMPYMGMGLREGVYSILAAIGGGFLLVVVAVGLVAAVS